MELNRDKKARQATLLSFCINAILTGIKITAGILGRSGAMVADGIHTFSDFITDIIVFASIRITRKPADSQHNYGHGKIENVASLLISVTLFLVGASLFRDGFDGILSWIRGESMEEVGGIALVAAGVSILVKELLFRYTKKVGEQIGNQAVIANAWHNRSDAMSSVGTFLGVGGAVILGAEFSFLDAFAQVFVSFFIFRVAYQILFRNIHQLMDISLNEKQIGKIKAIVENHKDVMDYHKLRTRKTGNLILIDLHVLMNKDLTVDSSHQITVEIEQEIMALLGESTVVIIHVEPFG